MPKNTAWPNVRMPVKPQRMSTVTAMLPYRNERIRMLTEYSSSTAGPSTISTTAMSPATAIRPEA